MKKDNAYLDSFSLCLCLTRTAPFCDHLPRRDTTVWARHAALPDEGGMRLVVSRAALCGLASL